MRFDVVQEPTGLWSVFDGASDQPAEFQGKFLMGLSRDDAERAALAANREFSGRLTVWMQDRRAAVG